MGRGAHPKVLPGKPATAYAPRRGRPMTDAQQFKDRWDNMRSVPCPRGDHIADRRPAEAIEGKTEIIGVVSWLVPRKRDDGRTPTLLTDWRESECADSFVVSSLPLRWLRVSH